MATTLALVVIAALLSLTSLGTRFGFVSPPVRFGFAPGARRKADNAAVDGWFGQSFGGIAVSSAPADRLAVDGALASISGEATVPPRCRFRQGAFH
ncbi:hypothetical protein [Vogesella sp. EB]|uniref:hypothetical protein n=1 Tax=Vogesella sp. EB TaxID=1526735 RepID=UPI0012E0038F|nr:hypothetical protein [Vogesella sp. EB]